MYDSTTEVVIQELIHKCQRNIDEQYKSLVANEYLKQKMKIVQDAPGDLDELEQLLKAKEWENEKATYIEDTKQS
jgi:PleD family two-component response regulator